MTIKNKITVITGGAQGLGKALAIAMLEQQLSVYIIDKNKRGLVAIKKCYPALHAIHADVSTNEGRQRIKEKLAGIPIHYLIHNAAIVVPLVPMVEIKLGTWRCLQATNVEAPLFLTQLLLANLVKNARILHISSDCAHYPLAHWIPYCTSKAALSMLTRCLQKELMNQKIYVGSIDPGMMHTSMQRYICEVAMDFPEKLTMTALKKQHLIYTPEQSAHFCLQILLETSNTVFVSKEWRFQEKD